MSAGNDLNQSVALVAAANKVLQDPSQVGAALRTIALRIRGTSLKVLEEMGEETDGVIESVSKLQEKVKAISGVNILDDTGAYRDTYDILRDIAEVWDEIGQKDPKGQAALLEMLAGKNRSNALAAILTNLNDLEGAYESAMDAQGSAEAENEKYMNSIQGKIDQFNNALQTMWMSWISSGFVKNIVEAGTAVVKLAEKLGLIPSILAVIAGYNLGKIFVPQIITAFSTALKANIATITGETVAIEALNAAKVRAKIVNAANIGDDTKQIALKTLLTTTLGKETIATDLKTVADIKAALMQKGLNAAEAEGVIAAMGLTGANGVLGASFGTLTASIGTTLKALKTMLLTTPVGWVIMAAAAITIAVSAYNGLKQAETEAAQAAQQSAQAIQEKNNSLDSYKGKIESLRASLDKGNLSEEEAYNTRKELISIQDELISKYGDEVQGINLVTGAIEDQVAALDKLKIANANTWLDENNENTGWFGLGKSVIEQAIDAMEDTQTTFLSLGTEIWNQAFRKAYGNSTEEYFEKNTKAVSEFSKFIESLGGTFNSELYSIRFTNVTKEQIKDYYEQITNYLRQLEAQSGGKLDLGDMIGKISADKTKQIGEDFETHKANYDAYLENTAITKYTDYYGRILDAQEKFKEEYAKGNKEGAKEARAELDAAIAAAVDAAGEGSRQAEWFKGLDDAFENIFHDMDFTDAWDKAGSQLKSSIKQTLKDASFDEDIDILGLKQYFDDAGKLIVDQNIAKLTDQQVAGYQVLAKAAAEYGMSIDELIAKLVQLGVIQGSTFATTPVESAGKAYSSYASTLEKFTNAGSIANEIIYDNIELTEEQGKALQELIGSEAEYADAVDTSNGYVVKNAKLVKDLIAKKRLEAAQNVKIEKAQARLKYYDLYKQMEKLSGANGKLAAQNKDQINTLYAEMGIVQQTISKYSMLEQQLLGAADAYDKFSEAQTADAESDYSSKMTDMLTALINGLQTGKIGTEAFKAAVQGLIPDEELNKLDTVEDKVKAIVDYITTSNFKDYFTFEFDDDTLKDITITFDNVKAFVEDGFKNGALIQTGEDWTQFELSAQTKTLDDLAKAYGVTKEAAFAYLQLINQHDGEWLIGDFATTFDSLIPTAATIKEAGEQMQKAFDQANVDLTLRPQVSWEKMNEAGWDTEEGSYSTVNTVSYFASDFGLADKGSSEDYVINVTPILPDGTVIKGGDEGLWEYINDKKNNGENIEDLDVFLGKYSSLEESKKAAQALHEAQEAYFEMVNNYSIDNDISETTRQISELDVQLANGKITQEEYMAKMYGIGDAATKTQQATGGLKGNLDALGDAARDNISAWKNASDGYAKAKETVTELEEQIKNASDDALPSLKEQLAEATSKMMEFGNEMSAHEYTELTIQVAMDAVQKDIDAIDHEYSELAKNVAFDNESGTYNIATGIEWKGNKPDQATIDNYLKLLDERHTLEVMQGEEVPTVLDTLTEINNVLNTITTILAKKYGIDIETGESTNRLQTILDQLSEIKPKQVIVEVLGKFSDGLTALWGKLTGSNDTPQINTSKSNPKSMLHGTAHSSGDWGLPHNEHNTLVGELGQETVVDPHTGRYYTVGDNGAELIDLPKDAIIFNHKQTEELFKNGHINSRGKAYVEGNAHVDLVKKSIYGETPWIKKLKSGSSSRGSASAAAEDAAEIFDWFEVLLEEINEQLDLMNAKLENAVGIEAKGSILGELLGENHYKLTELNEGLKLYTDYAAKMLSKVPDEYKEMAKNGAVAITDFLGEADQKTVDAINNYREWAQKVADLNQQLEETRTTISDLRVQTLEMIRTEYDNEIGLITTVNDHIQSTIDLLEEQGQRSSSNFFTEMIANSEKQLDTLKEQREAMQKELDDAVASGDVKKYSENWYEMLNAIYDVDSAIVDCKTDIEKFNNAILELHWENFEKIIDALDAVSDEAEQIRSIIDDSEITDDVGNWTNNGFTALGMAAQEMEKARYRADLYGKEIEQLNQDFAAGKYSQDEYNEKLKELKDAQWDSIEAYESAKDTLVDLNKTRVEAVKDGIQKEIDAYEKLIDKRKEDLNAQKDAHDWANTLKDRTDEIDKIQRQIDAMTGDTSAAANAQRKKLQEELAKAQKELDETYYDRDIEMQQKALDDSLESYRQSKEDRIQELEDYLKNEDQVISDSYALILANTDAIASNLQEIAQRYGISISENVTAPWESGTTALGTYGEELDYATSTYVDMLEKVRQKLIDLQVEADKTAAKLVKDINTSANQSQNANQTSGGRKDIAGFAKGTTGVKKDQFAVIDENGLEELVMHADGGKLSYLTKGTAVIPNDLTNNIMKWGEIDPVAMLDRNKPSIGAPYIIENQMQINMDIAEVVHIEHADRDSIPEIQDAVKKQLDSYMKNLNSGIKKYTR